MTAAAIIGPKFYGWDNNGNRLSGGKVYAYEPGTSTPKATYTDETATTQNAHPVVLNAAGFASIYLVGTYKIVLTDASDVEIWTADPVTDATQLAQEWVKSTDATQVDATSFTVDGNQTETFVAGRRVRLEDDTILYGDVVSSSYTSPSTTVTVSVDDETALTAALTEVRVSNATPLSSVRLFDVKISEGTKSLIEALNDRVIRLNSTADFFEGGYDGQRVHVLSRTAPLFPSTHFHGGGTFYWDSASEEVVDSGTIFQVSGVSTGRWKRVYNQGDMEAVWFGVIGGGTNVTTEAQSAIDATPIGGTLWMPAFEILVDSLSNPERKNIRGRGWRCPTRAAFGNTAWDDSSGFHGSVVRFTATTGNAFTFGDEVVGSFNFGGSLRDVLLVGPGSGTSVGLYLWNAVSCKMDNVAVANFGIGMDWDFVEDTLFKKFSHWGCDTGLTSHVQGNNENTFSSFEFNRCNTNIVATWGKNNKFFGGLMQHSADRCEVYDTTGAGGGELESWIFEGVWYENDTVMTGNSLTIAGDNIEMIIHRDCRYDTISDFSLTSGTNNRGHVFERLRNHTGTMNLTIPSGMARCVVDELYQFDVTDNSKDSILSEKGSFTGTLTGVDTEQTGSISYTRYDRTCTLDIPSITGTSNSSAMTITGSPQNLMPKNTTGWAFARIMDNGAISLGICRVKNDGVIEFLSNIGGGSFTASGTKGTQGFTLTYAIQ